jgi:V-type H+-transporting ATPase subunit C
LYIRLIKKDEEYALYTVTLFHRVVDAFKSAAHEKSFQVREFHYNAETIQSEASERNDRVREVEERSAALDSLCRACYRNVISDWIHVCAIRIFVESVLRYGLPPNFFACIIKPHKKSEIKLRWILRDWLGHGALLNWDIFPEDEKRNMERSYPYVSFALIL